MTFDLSPLDFQALDIRRIITLTLLLSICLLILQRTEKKFRWASLLFLVLPAGFALYRWAEALAQREEAIVAGGSSLVLILIFWVVYGRAHPPGTSDAINVVGSDT
ncbi:MAG: hypothetical protein IT326_00315 [Anaerolineae bacterium]|nr:hypothetical protein [Anaerolineae bacterium]